MPEFARCVGGTYDGQWIAMKEFHTIEHMYELMPIFAPQPSTQGYRFTIVKDRELAYADVVLRLLNGYCPEIILESEDESSEWEWADFHSDDCLDCDESQESD